MPAKTTVERKKNRVTVTTGDMKTVFEAGNDEAAAAQIASLHTEIERLRDELVSQEEEWDECENTYLGDIAKLRAASLRGIQQEQVEWVAHNFGTDRPAWHPLLGVQEEVGELSHAFLKRAQGIRVNEDHDAAIKDAVADIVIYLLDFCTAEGIDLQSVLAETWAQVKARDWKVAPESGVSDE